MARERRESVPCVGLLLGSLLLLAAQTSPVAAGVYKVYSGYSDDTCSSASLAFMLIEDTGLLGTSCTPAECNFNGEVFNTIACPPAVPPPPQYMITFYQMEAPGCSGRILQATYYKLGCTISPAAATEVNLRFHSEYALRVHKLVQRRLL